jgi:regulator of cell morphogenesis and NO signaling
VFERHGIDYCCGGEQTLEEACRKKGLDLAAVRQELEAATAVRETGERDWRTAPLRELIEHIVGTHHAYLRRELGPLNDRLAKVFRIYNERYGPTLIGLPEVFAGLRSELEMHMLKEERVLFPAIQNAEAAVAAGQPLPRAPFGSFSNPVSMMVHEHESAGQALAKIRAITGEFAIPDYACTTYRALMKGLEELEKDLHVHIHLENNVLFPRAMQLEGSAG